MAAGRHPRPCRGGLRRVLQRLGHLAAAQEARALAPEDQATTPAGRSGRAGRVQKRGLDRSSRRSPRRIRTRGSSSGARMRPGSGRRAGPATAGTSAACARPGWPTSGSRASTCSPPAARAATKPSRWPCRKRPSRPWTCSWPPSPGSSRLARMPSSSSTRPAGTARRGSPSPTTSRSCRCRLTALSSIRSNGRERRSRRLYLRERFLSHRLLTDYPAVLDAACEAWNALVAETGRLASLTAYPYLTKSELR